MSLRISEVICEFKQKWTELLEAESIRRICKEVGYTWRERVLDPVTTLHIFILQVLHGNTALTGVPHLINEDFSASAYCLARARLPLEVFRTLLSRVGDRLNGFDFNDYRWHGHRIFLADSTGCSMPDTEALQKKFPQPAIQRPGCGFPVSRITALLHAGTGMILDILPASLSTHDITEASKLHPKLQQGDILLADRAYCSYPHLALLVQQKLHAVFRQHASQRFDFGPRGGCLFTTTGKKTVRLRKLGKTDQIIKWEKPRRTPKWISNELFAALPAVLILRQLQYKIFRRGFRSQVVTVVTTLLDARRYPADQIAQLYAKRWEIELNFRHLKTTMGMDILRSNTVEGVLKELYVYCLVYNLVRSVILQAAKKQKVLPAQLSFVDALRQLASLRPPDSILKIAILPQRPLRLHPRRIKRRPKYFPLLRKPRSSFASPC